MKKHRMTIGLDKEDLDFLRGTNVFKNNSDGIRWCIKFCKIYGIPGIKALREKIK
jgi:hypothetical protein